MKRAFGMLAMLLKENFVAGSFLRVPEPQVMAEEEQVTAWHAQGARDGPIIPVYHLVALACSRLLPTGSTVVDLGCGSGRFAAYLARLRPDIRAIGFDLSAGMVETGNASLRTEGLAGRVLLEQGDMTSFADRVPPETALVNCLFALHHLPRLVDVERCLAEIRAAGDRTGASFFLFDLARPRHRSTPMQYPRVLSPDAPEAFKVDSTNSLLAAFTYDEMRLAVERVFSGTSVRATKSRFFPLYQAFWQDTANGRGGSAVPELPDQGRQQYRALRWTLPEISI